MNIEKILSDIKSDRIKKVIIDSDTANEMDDQYAIAYALSSDITDVLSINAAPFYCSEEEKSLSELNDGESTPLSETEIADRCYETGMLRSYDEILRVLDMVGKKEHCPVYKGSNAQITEHYPIDYIESDAADNIIKTANTLGEMLYIISIGACTNVISAINKAPEIKDKICVIWLGSNCADWENQAEYNLVQDLKAGQMLINSGVNLVLVPALSPTREFGSGSLIVFETEMKNINSGTKAGVFFSETLPREFESEEDKTREKGWCRTLWDIAGVAVLTMPKSVRYSIITAPVITDTLMLENDSTRHQIILADRFEPNEVMNDAYKCINKL